MKKIGAKRYLAKFMKKTKLSTIVDNLLISLFYISTVYTKTGVNGIGSKYINALLKQRNITVFCLTAVNALSIITLL